MERDWRETDDVRAMLQVGLLSSGTNWEELRAVGKEPLPSRRSVSRSISIWRAVSLSWRPAPAVVESGPSGSSTDNTWG